MKERQKEFMQLEDLTYVSCILHWHRQKKSVAWNVPLARSCPRRERNVRCCIFYKCQACS